MNAKAQNAECMTHNSGNEPKRWLITGGCGFIGTNLIKNLVEEGGNYIRVIDNLSVGTREDLARVCEFQEISPSPRSTHNSRVELVGGDILDEQLALNVCQGVDIIVHLAANTGVGPSVENPRKDCMLNVIGTLNYLEAARKRKVKRFVFASSGAPAGEVEPPIHEELPPKPISPYGASKLAGEGYCSAYARTFGVETVCLRFGNVYGPLSSHKSSVVAKFIRRALAGQTLEIYGDGTQTRDFIFIDDLIDAVKRASSIAGLGGEVFQIATSAETTIGEVTDLLLALFGKAGIAKPKILFSAPRLGDAKRNYSDTSKAKKMMDWQARSKLEEGLQTTLEWFLKCENR